jgi:hypothetical protein
MTSQEQADELLRDWQERRGRSIAPERPLDSKREKINDGGVTIKNVEAGIVLFVFLVSLREELRARKDAVTRANRQVRKQQKKLVLPRYVERNHRNGKLSFRVDRSARIPLPKDPTTPEFRAAYSRALVDAIAAEKDDDWRELERYHELQRRREVHRAKRAVV